MALYLLLTSAHVKVKYDVYNKQKYSSESE
jgi:hypothetical protein